MEDLDATRELAEARLEALRAERSLEHREESSAALDYEIGAILEHSLGQDADALRHYLLSFNESPSFRPAFDALRRVLERRGATENLIRLHLSDLNAATTREARADARIALASVEASGEAWDRAAEHLHAAAEDAPGSAEAAAFLELVARRTGDERLLVLALERRLAATTSPALLSILATDRAERGDLSLLERVKRLSSVTDSEGLASRALADGHLELGDHAARARALVHAAEHLASAGETTEAALLFAEAAAVELEVSFSPRAALAHARRATELLDAAPLRLLAWEAARRAGDRFAVEAFEREILARDLPDAKAEIHVEAALRALDDGEPKRAREHATRALEATPSVALLLLLDNVSARLGAHAERVERLSAWARSHADDAGWALALASDVAARELGDAGTSAELAKAAHRMSQGAAGASARAFELAKRTDDPEALDAAAADLVRRATSPDARRAALFERLRLRVGPAPLPADEALLEVALGEPEPWAPELVRLQGAVARHPTWLGRAHEALARLASDDAARAAHLATAARMSLMERDVAGAGARARDALASRPHHPYALALAAEIERRLGRAEAAATLHARREQSRVAKGREPLEDALAAEARGDLERAARIYADRTDDPLALDGLRRVSPLVGAEIGVRGHEILVAEGAPGAKASALELSLRGLGAARPDLDPSDLEMAWDAMLSERSESARVEASEALTAGDPKLVPLMKVARHFDGLASDLRFEPRVDGVLGRYVECRSASPASRATALGAIASEDDAERRELAMLSIALRANQGGEAALADAFIEAQALLDERFDGVSALAVEETVSFADDPAQLGHALLERLSLSSSELAGALTAAGARALAHSRSRAGADALEAARRAVADDPEDLSSWDALRVAARSAEDFKRVTRACEVLADAAPPRWAAALLDEAGVAYAEHLGDPAAAEVTFRKALRVDPRGTAALGRLRELYRETERDDARIELLTEYASAASDDDPALPGVLFELAGVLRAGGRLEDANACVERLLARSVDDPEALALAAEINVARARWDDSVRYLRRLAVANVPQAQQRIARLAAADFLEKKLERPDAALVELGELFAAGLADAKTVERMGRLNVRLERHEDAAKAFEHAARRLTGAEAARLFVQAGRLRAIELGQLDLAEQLYRRALQLHPLALDAVVGLLELTADAGEGRRLAERASEILRASLPLTRCEVGLIRAIRALAVMRGDHERGAAMLEALVALGAASHEELSHTTEVTTIVKPRGFSADALVGAIAELDAEAPLAKLGRQLMPTLLTTLGIGLEPLGFTRHDRLTATSRSPARDELNDIAARFGLGPLELYRGGLAPRGIHLVPMKKGATWLVGEEVKSPLSPAMRFSAAAQAFGLLRGTLPFVILDQPSAEALLARLALAEGRPIAGLSEDPAGLAAYDAIEESLGFFGRRSGRELLAALGSAADASQAIAAARQEAHRAGLAVVLDIHEALRLLVGGEVTPASVEASRDALALLSFWIRPEASEFRALAGANA